MNRFHDAVEFSIDLVIPKSQNLIAGIFQCCVAQGVPLASLIHGVLPAIDFDNEPASAALEISDVRENWRLAAKMKPE
jgi:hypothetical protein